MILRRLVTAYPVPDDISVPARPEHAIDRHVTAVPRRARRRTPPHRCSHPPARPGCSRAARPNPGSPATSAYRSRTAPPALAVSPGTPRNTAAAQPAPAPHEQRKRRKARKLKPVLEHQDRLIPPSVKARSAIETVFGQRRVRNRRTGPSTHPTPRPRAVGPGTRRPRREWSAIPHRSMGPRAQNHRRLGSLRPWQDKGRRVDHRRPLNFMTG